MAYGLERNCRSNNASLLRLVCIHVLQESAALVLLSLSAIKLLFPIIMSSIISEAFWFFVVFCHHRPLVEATTIMIYKLEERI